MNNKLPLLLILISSCNNPITDSIHDIQNKVKEFKEIDTFTNYQPSKPIDFPHAKHAEMDCKICHNSPEKTENVNLSEVNVCINCHNENDSVSKINLENLTEINDLDSTKNNLEECYYLLHPYASENELSKGECSKCHY